MKRSHVIFALVGALAFTAGCQITSLLPPNAMRNPRGLALVCVEEGVTKPLDQCKSANSVRPLITGGSVGSVAVAAFKGDQWQWLDLDAAVPGFTPLMIGDLPTEIVADASAPNVMHVTLALKRELVTIDTEALSTAALQRLPLPFLPSKVLSVAAPSRRLYISEPTNGRVWRIDLDTSTPTPKAIDVGGSPTGLAAANGALYVAHREHPHVTVVNLADDKVIKRIGLRDACSDGVDNDGDGLTDSADSGCDGVDDPIEGDPEVGDRCSDGLDNDGDGATDAADFGCAVTPTEDHCRDGVDNDGDGLTDYPDDPGCAGFGGSSERLDRPACDDGVDNDGDGLTDLDDDDCAGDSDGEFGALDAQVIGACGDGVDNDGDGLTDLDDAKCDSAQSDDERRPPCADGVDNDGDGLTDLDDPHCVNRATPSEVSSDRTPKSAIAASFSGELVIVTDQYRQSLFIIDAKTQSLLKPGADGDFVRAPKLDGAANIHGVVLEGAPLAVAPVTLEGQDAIAVTTRLGRLMYLSLFEAAAQTDGPAKRAIGVLPSAAQKTTTAQRPSLVVEDTVVDLGIQAPERYAHFGTLNLQTNDKGQVSYYGWSMSESVDEHRSELWRVRAQGLIPGTARSSGRIISGDMLVDAEADFCGLGVVPGDLLLVHEPSSGCADLDGATVRYKVTEVGPQHLKVDPTTGAVDQPVTSDNQLTYTPGSAVGALQRQCYPRRSVRYEVRADGWLVTGARTGLLSKRGAVGALCAPWDNRSPLQAARIAEPALKSDADPTTLSCPIKPDQLSAFQSKAYGGAEASDGYENLIWSAKLIPGCSPAESPGGAVTVVPSVRDATWNYVISRGFTPLSASVGANPVAVKSGPGLNALWVIDQGAGTLHTLGVGSSITTATLD